MVENKRRSKRHHVYHGARLIQSDGTALGPCRMIDISRTGARLESAKAQTLPDDFILLLSHDGRLRRQCLVVWRSETAVGVEFVPLQPSSNSAAKTTGAAAKTTEHLQHNK